MSEINVFSFPLISMTHNSIDENASNGTEIGSLYTYNQNGETYTYTLLDDAGGRFKLAGNTIIVADGTQLDYEMGNAHEITFRATDSKGVSTDMTFTIDVLNVIEAGEKPPVLVSMTNNTVEENASDGTEVGLFESFSPSGEAYTYSLIDDAGGRFKLEGNKLVIADGSKLDFETAESHEVSIRVTDSNGIETDMVWTVDVLDNFMEESYIFGGKKADKLYGTTGQDVISGGLGKDYLFGGAGSDMFRFDSKLGKFNVDRIADFSVKYDTIELHRSAFTKLKPGDLNKAAFWTGARAHDANDRIIYDSKKGKLYYDQDGSGASKQVLFATLSKNLKMTADDFLVIF